MSSQEAQIPEPAPETIIKDYDEEKLKPEKESKAHLVEGEIFSGPPSNAAVISEVLQIPAAADEVSVNPKQDQVVIDELQSDETNTEIVSQENVVDIGSVTNGACGDELVAKNDPETSVENNEDESQVVAEQDAIQSTEPEVEKEKAELHLPTEKGEDKEEENTVTSTKDDTEEHIITEGQPEDEVKKQEEASLQDVGGVDSRDESEYQDKATLEGQISPEAEETKSTDKAEEDETGNASAEAAGAIHEKAVEVVQTSEIKQEDQEIEDKAAEEDETENASAEYTDTTPEKKLSKLSDQIKQEDQDIEDKAAEEDETDNASAEYTETTHEKEAVEVSEIKHEDQEIEDKAAEEVETENASAEYTEIAHEKEAVVVVPTSEFKQEDQEIEDKAAEEVETENASVEYTETAHEKEAVDVVPTSEVNQEDQDIEDKAAEEDETDNASAEYTETTHEKEAVEVSEIKHEDQEIEDKAAEEVETENASAEYTEIAHEKEAVVVVPTSEFKQEDQEIEDKAAEEVETENASAEYTETAHEKEAVDVVPTSEVNQEDQEIEDKAAEVDETENASAIYTETTPEKETVEVVATSEIKHEDQEIEDKAAEEVETENASAEYTEIAHEKVVDVVPTSEIKQEDQVIEDKTPEEDETENASTEYTEIAHEKEAVDVVPNSEIKQVQEIEDEGQQPLVEEVISRDYIEGVPTEQHTSTDDKLELQRDDETAKEEALTDSQIDNNLTGDDAKTQNAIEEKKFVEQNEDVEVQADSSPHHHIDEIPKDKELSEVVEENAETMQIEKDDEDSKGNSEGIAAVDTQPNNELQKEDTEEAYQEGESTFESKKQYYEGVDQAQIPSEVEETKPEQDVEEAAEVKTDENVNEALDEKLKEKEEVQNKDVDFCVEEATAQSSVKDDMKEEQETTIEEKSEIKEEDETEKIEQEDDGKVDDSKVDDDMKQQEAKPKETVDDRIVAEEIEKVADQEDEEVKKLDSSEEQSSNGRNIIISDAENTEIIDKHGIEQIPEDIPELHESVILHSSEEPEIEKEAVEDIIESQADEVGEGTSVQEEGEIESTDSSVDHAHENSLSGETVENLEEARVIETEALNAKLKEEKELQNKDEDHFVEQTNAESFLEEEERVSAEKSEIKVDETEKFEKEDDDIKQDETRPEETVDDPEVAEEKIVEDHEDEVEKQLDSSNEQSSKDRNIVSDAENTEIIDKHEIAQIPEDLREIHESVISHKNRELEIEKETLESQLEKETSKHGEREVESADDIDQANLSKSEVTVENLDEAGELETESEAISQSDETSIEKEIVDIGISNEKIKKEEQEKEEDEVKQDKDLQLPSSVEEGNAESFLEVGIKQEQETSTEDKYETTNIIEQPSSLESKFVEENTPAEEEGKVTEEDEATSYGKQVHGLPHASLQAESEDTLEKIETKTETGNKALEEFESRHAPEIQQFEVTTQAQDLEKVEGVKVEENPEAEAEKETEQDELEVEIPREKEDEVAHEALHSHVDEVVTTSCKEEGVKQEQDAVTEVKKSDEEENIKKDVAAREDEAAHVPASTEEVDENTIKESHAEEGEVSVVIKIQEATIGLDPKEGLAVAQEPIQLEHKGSAEKTEEKAEDEKHCDISDLEEAVTTESSQHENLIEEAIEIVTPALESEENRGSDEANEESIQKIEKENEAEKDGGEVIATDSSPEAITNKEEEASGEEKLEATVETDEVEKVSEIPESAHEQITEQPREVSGADELNDGSKYEEEAKSSEPVSPAFDDAYSPDNAVTETEEDSTQKIEKENEAEKDDGEVIDTDSSSEVEKVSEISESAPEQIIEQPREVSGANEHTDGSKYEEEATSTETVTPAFEDAYHPDNAVVETEGDSAQKVEKEDEKEKEIEEVLSKDKSPEDETGQEEEKYAEEQHEAISEANEIKKVSESPQKVDQPVIKRLSETLEETEPIDERTYQGEEEKHVETVTPVLDSEQTHVSDHTVANTENEDTEEKGLEEADQAISFQHTIDSALEEVIDSVNQKAPLESNEAVKSVVESQDAEQKDIKQLNEILCSKEPINESIGQQEKEESNEKATHELENEEAPSFGQAHTETESLASTQKIEDTDKDTKSSHPENNVTTEYEEFEADQILDAKVDANESEQKSEGAGQINQLVATVEDVEDTSSSSTSESDSEEEVKEVVEQTAEEFLGHPKENLEQIDTTVKSIIQEEIEGNTEKVITVVDSKETHESDHESKVNSSSTAIPEEKATDAGANPLKESSLEDTGVEELGKNALEEQVSRALIPEQEEDHKATEYTEKKEIKGEQKDDPKQTSAVAIKTLESKPREVVADPTIKTSSRDIQDSVLAASLQEEYVILEAADHTKTGSPRENEEEKLEETEEAQSKESLSNLLQASVRTNQEDPATEKTDTKAAEEAEVEEEEEQGHVEDSGDADSKAQSKKHSQHLLSGVGSKVKHSLGKVKKAITGKSKPK